MSNYALAKESYPDERSGGVRRLPLLEKLAAEKANLNERIKQIDRAVEILNKYPEIEELINLI